MYQFIWQPIAEYADPKKERRHVAWLAMAVASIPVFTLLAQLAVGMIVGLFFPALTEKSWFSIVFGSLSMYLIAMPLAYLLFRRAEPSAPAKNSLGAFSLPALLSVALVFTILGGLMGNFVNLILSALTGQEIANPVESATTGTPMWANILFMAILAPILEEIFFRKLVIDRLRRYGDLPAILISGVIFGAIHGNFSQFFYALILGILFGAVYCRTGKLSVTIALHMFINFFGGILSTLVMRAFDGEIPEAITPEVIAEYAQGFALMGVYYSILGLAFLAFLPSAFYLFPRLKPSRSAPLLLNAECRRSAFLLNPAVWILSAILILYFAFGMM